MKTITTSGPQRRTPSDRPTPAAAEERAVLAGVPHLDGVSPVCESMGAGQARWVSGRRAKRQRRATRYRGDSNARGPGQSAAPRNAAPTNPLTGGPVDPPETDSATGVPGQAEAERIAADTRVIARALPAGHPALGAGEPDGPTAPVLLFEPRRALMIDDGAGSETELQIEMIVQAGFGSRIAEPSADLEAARGWTLRAVDGELQLSDHEDGLWARTPLEPDSAWTAAAAAVGHVVVLYGFRLGVRPADRQTDQPEHAFTDTARAEELRGACAHGWVAGARVDWAGHDSSAAVPTATTS